MNSRQSVVNSISALLLICAWTLASSVVGAAEYNAKNTFNIVEYGAVEGGGELCAKAIQKAIDACAEAGRGRVLVPAGTFLTGTVVLKAGVNLHLDDGAVLLGSPSMRDYPPQSLLSKARYDRYLLTSLVFAQGVDGVSVSGKGTLNGNSKGANDFMAEGREGKHRPCLIWFDECTKYSSINKLYKLAGARYALGHERPGSRSGPKAGSAVASPG